MPQRWLTVDFEIRKNWAALIRFYKCTSFRPIAPPYKIYFVGKAWWYGLATAQQILVYKKYEEIDRGSYRGYPMFIEVGHPWRVTHISKWKSNYMRWIIIHECLYMHRLGLSISSRRYQHRKGNLWRALWSNWVNRKVRRHFTEASIAHRIYLHSFIIRKINSIKKSREISSLNC